MHYLMKCNHAPEYVMGIEDISYNGAGQKDAQKFIGDLMVNFTNISDVPSALYIPELEPHIDIGFKKEIMVPWPDFGVPLVRPSFWEALHKYIIKENWNNVCFHCEAGHGRTGTALSCMLIAIQGYTPEEAVTHIRTHYCEEAVETYDQCEYLQAIDEYYNHRQPLSNNIPVPSMVFKLQRKHDKQKSDAENRNNKIQEDKYEGFAGVNPN